MILRKIGKSCVEPITGFFVRLDGEDPTFEEDWVKGCIASGINAKPVSIKDALVMEPRLTRKIKSVYEVPDGAIDGFRMSWQNLESAVKYGARYKTYTEVVGIDIANGCVQGVTVRDTIKGEEYKIACDYLVNAAGPWSGKIASLAGLECTVSPSKGTLISFNQRITNHVINAHI